MKTRNQQLISLLTLVCASVTLTLGATSALATEQSKQRQTGRDVKQDTRQGSRETKQDCRAANDSSNSDCRQDKRESKQDGRDKAREIKY